MSVREREGTSAFAELVGSVLDLQPAAHDAFVGRRPSQSLDRIYGGELIAQGTLAAARTAPGDRLIHSSRVSFLRRGDPAQDVLYSVERQRDSALFSTRGVRATQGSRLLAVMQVSLQVQRAGVEHARAPRDPIRLLPAPETLPRREVLLTQEFGTALPRTAAVPWPIDIRYVDRVPWAGGRDADRRPVNRMWVRADGVLGDDPHDHAAVLAYSSDLAMFEPVIFPHSEAPHHLSWEALNRGTVRGASLDHAIWLHGPFRADAWLLHEQESTWASGSRGLTLGRYYTEDGVLVASVAQEVALLVPPPDPDMAS